GPHPELEVGLARDLRLDGSIKLDDFDTREVLDRSMLPMLGGRLSGEVRAHGRLGARAVDMSATLDEARLHLDRFRRGPYPRRFNFWMGAPPSGEPGDEVDLSIGAARLARGEGAVEG